MRGSLVETEDLLAITGCKHAGDAARKLREQGIKVFDGRKGRPWTTIELINAAGGLLQQPAAANSPPLSPDDI